MAAISQLLIPFWHKVPESGHQMVLDGLSLASDSGLNLPIIMVFGGYPPPLSDEWVNYPSSSWF